MAARLLVVEDHAVLSGAMADSLRSQGFDQVEVADPDDLGRDAVVRLADRVRPDVVLLDLFLGDQGVGVDLVAPLTALGAKVVMLSASHDEPLLAECLEAGAVGLLDKAMRFDALVDAVRKVVAGESLMADSARAELLAGLRRHRDEQRARLAPFERLTGTEQEVLRMLVEGSAPKQIARSRGVSVATVRNQVQAVLTKLGVSSEREALALVRDSGWGQRTPDR